MDLMHYPAQEPLSPLGQAYAREALARGTGLVPVEARYGEDPYQGLSVFEPDSGNGIMLVFFHGGGWTSGYKEWMHFMAPALNAAGVTVVLAGYRLAPQHVFPAGLHDCARALAWASDWAQQRFGRQARLFVGGHSAGGHYASLLALTDPWGTALGMARPAIAGCLPISGVYRFGAGSGLSVRPRFLGPHDDAAIDHVASPLHQVGTQSIAPFFMAWGENDFAHLKAQATEMAAALRAAGGAVTECVLPKADHFQASLCAGDSQGPWLPAAVQWMQSFFVVDPTRRT
jgi:acetyl esterase/lipase